DLGGKSLRQHARDVVGETAAGDMGERLDGAGSANRVEDAPDIDAGRGEQSGAERRLGGKRRGIAPVESRLLDHAAHEREAVGVHAGGGQGEDDVSRFDIFPRQQRFALYRADGEAGEIVVAGRIDPRHLGGLAADQRRAGLLAAFGDAADHRWGHAEIELAGGEIVEKEQRLGALHDDVVDVHGDEVDADAVVNAGFDGEVELGADAVGGGDQHGVLEAANLEIEQTAEATDAAKQTFALGLGR